MRYDHELFDCMLKILQHGKEQLIKRGNGTMAAEVDRVYLDGVNNFSLPHNQLAWALGFICKEQGVLPTIELDTFNADEKRAVEDKDLTASSTKDAKKSVLEAGRRLAEDERLRPVTEAKEKLDQMKSIAGDKKQALKESEAERMRPEREVEAAEREAKEAAAELKRTEKEIVG